MGTEIERALQKMILMGCKVHPIGDYYLVEDMVTGFKILKERKGEVLESQFYERVQRLGNTKVIVYKSGRFSIFDTVAWEEGTFYKNLEAREVYGNRIYLVYKLDGFYGVVDDEDNQIVPHRYTFINFVNIGEYPPIIVGTKVDSGINAELTSSDELYSIRGEFYTVSRVLKGKPYFILGDKVYMRQGNNVTIYNLKGDVIRNGGNG